MTNLPSFIPKFAILFGVVKGIILSFVLFTTGSAFIQQLIIAVTSAVIGAAGVMLAAIITVHLMRQESNKQSERLEKVIREPLAEEE